MTRIVNAYTINPDDIQPGDIMMFVVKAMVVFPGHYQIYRCPYEGSDVPQGDRITLEGEVAQAIFPSLALVAEPSPF